MTRDGRIAVVAERRAASDEFVAIIAIIAITGNSMTDDQAPSSRITLISSGPLPDKASTMRM